MAESKIKDENYFQINGWMLNRLKLKGISLEVYAIIYGFSQDGESEFRGSISYLCDFTGTSRPTVIKALKELVAGDYIIKDETEINGVKFNKYKANLQVVKELNGGSKETLQGGSKETLPNNKEKDTDIDNKKERKTTYDKIIGDRITDAELKDLIYEFVKMRKMKKKPLTDRALTIQLNKLIKLGTTTEEQKQIVENSIVRCWDEFYPLRKEADNGTVKNNSKADGSEYSMFS